MPLLLLIQSVFYDRPRLFKQLKADIKSMNDLKSFIANLHSNDPFKSIAQVRLDSVLMSVQKLESLNIQWLDQSSPYYPSLLHHLDDPPLGLFFMGDPTILTDSLVGMVGTRRPSLTAESRLQSVFKQINGISTVSGGALGIDAIVHKLSLHFGIKTVCVLASGLDLLTPKTNLPLFKQMIQSGRACIISECPPGVIPKPYFFPQRNRIIAALSQRLIVVEAAKRSGAVLTANLAAGLGRDVGAMVSGYNDAKGEGCYELFNDGAFCIGNHQMLHDFLGTIPMTINTGMTDNYAIIEKIPTEPIHVERLSQLIGVSLEKTIELVTKMSLNDQVVLSAGQMVNRCE